MYHICHCTKGGKIAVSASKLPEAQRKNLSSLLTFICGDLCSLSVFNHPWTRINFQFPNTSIETLSPLIEDGYLGLANYERDEDEFQTQLTGTKTTGFIISG